MIRLIAFSILSQFFIVCMGQENHLDKDIQLYAYFDKDSVTIGDTLKLNLYYRNNSSNCINLYPQAIIGLLRNLEAFITYDSPERITYKLYNTCNYDSIVNLKPGEGFKYTFNIRMNSDFFYEGENTVLVYYHFFNKQTNDKKRRKSKRDPILSLWSPPITIKVNPR